MDAGAQNGVDYKQPFHCKNNSPTKNENNCMESPVFNYSSVGFNDNDDDQMLQLPEETDYENDENDSENEIQRQMKESRRSVISAVDVEAIVDGDFPDIGECFDKTPEDIERLIPQIMSVVLFEGYDTDELMLVVQYMYTRKIHQGEVVIEYGSDGNAVYVVKSGKYDCTVPDADGTYVPVRTYNGEGYFGELALINHTPRAATITAKTDGELWVLNALRHTWLRKKRAICNGERFHEVLSAIPLFRENLSSSQTNSLIDAIEVVNLVAGDVICRQGEHGDAMYFIMAGEVDAEINHKLVKRMSKNDFFGERALVMDEGRAATCIAFSERVKVAKLAKENFALMMPDSVVLKMRQHVDTKYSLESEAANQSSSTDFIRTGTCTFIGD